MLMGVRSNAGGSCHDYASAQRVLERAGKTPTGKQRQPKKKGFPLGGHAKSVTWVRELDNGAIAFQLYDTDVVIWAPDNSVYIDNFGTVTTSSFATRFLPAGVRLNHPTERRGYSGGHNTIAFTTQMEVKTYGTYRGGVHLCQGSLVRFVEQGEWWVPDEDTCDDITLPVGIDRAKTRDMARHFHLREFENWLSMAPMHLAATDEPVEHHSWDLVSCMNALEKREWRRAAEHLPLIEDKGAFGNEIKPLAILTARRDEHVTMRSLAKLKLAMWEDHSLLRLETRKVWDRKTYDRGMKRVKEMDALDLSVSGLGPL